MLCALNPCAPATTAQHLVTVILLASGESLIVEDTIFGTDDPDDTELLAMRICESFQLQYELSPPK